MVYSQHILITGGLGYIGQVLTRQLLENTSAKITIVDSNIYRIKSLSDYDASSQRVKIIQKDALKFILEDLISEFSAVIVLHGLVGDPISNKYNELAKRINEIEMQEFIEEHLKQVNKNRYKMSFFGLDLIISIEEDKLTFDTEFSDKEKFDKISKSSLLLLYVYP